MTIDDAFCPNATFYEPENEFWCQESRARISLERHQPEWPSAANSFVQRMAQTLCSNKKLMGISTEALISLIGVLLKEDNTRVFHFLVLPLNASGTELNVCLINSYSAAEPPMFADNCGCFSYAVSWYSQAKRGFEVSAAHGGLFWIHRA